MVLWPVYRRCLRIYGRQTRNRSKVLDSRCRLYHRNSFCRILCSRRDPYHASFCYQSCERRQNMITSQMAAGQAATCRPTKFARISAVERFSQTTQYRRCLKPSQSSHGRRGLECMSGSLNNRCTTKIGILSRLAVGLKESCGGSIDLQTANRREQSRMTAGMWFRRKQWHSF